MLPRIALVIVGLLLMGLVGVGVWLVTVHPFTLWRSQMAAGGTYMRSLQESDVPPWIERTERLLTQYDPCVNPIGVYGGVDGKFIPLDLPWLRIIRIDVLKDKVCYVWMGGMDHTYLEARRLPDGGFTLVAHYDDYHSEVIWPKKPNQVMERTTTRRALTLRVASTRSLRPILALGGRRSSCSR